MSAQTTVSWTDTGHPTLAGELLDALIEAVVFAPDPRARSAVVCSLLQEIGTTVEWRQEDDVDDPWDQAELSSIRLLVKAAHDHHLRMSGVQSDCIGADPR